MKIKPCPKCGSDNVGYFYDSENISCQSCGFQDYDDNFCKMLWNMLSDYSDRDKSSPPDYNKLKEANDFWENEFKSDPNLELPKEYLIKDFVNLPCTEIDKCNLLRKGVCFLCEKCNKISELTLERISNDDKCENLLIKIRCNDCDWNQATLIRLSFELGNILIDFRTHPDVSLEVREYLKLIPRYFELSPIQKVYCTICAIEYYKNPNEPHECTCGNKMYVTEEQYKKIKEKGIDWGEVQRNHNDVLKELYDDKSSPLDHQAHMTQHEFICKYSNSFRDALIEKGLLSGKKELKPVNEACLFKKVFVSNDNQTWFDMYLVGLFLPGEIFNSALSYSENEGYLDIEQFVYAKRCPDVEYNDD